MIVVRKTSATRSNKRDISNKNGEATVYLYGDIGGWFGIDHLEWIKEFNAIDAKTIHLRVDSDGGDIFAARAMKTAIMQHSAKVIAHIDGIAASAASFVSMGADEIEIVNGGFLMVHNALSLLDVLGFFNANDLDALIDDLRKERDRHDKINKSIADDYVKKSGADIDKVKGWMDDETWFTASEALENGLVDRVYDGDPVEGKHDFSLFNNVPKELMRRSTGESIEDLKEEPNDKRKAEKALRKAGFSRNEALKIVAQGFQDESDSQTEQIDKGASDSHPEGDTPQSDSEIADIVEAEEQKETADEEDKTAQLLLKANKLTNFKEN